MGLLMNENSMNYLLLTEKQWSRVLAPIVYIHKFEIVAGFAYRQKNNVRLETLSRYMIRKLAGKTSTRLEWPAEEGLGVSNWLWSLSLTKN